MKPFVLWTGIALFLFSLVLHVILWRRWHPRRHVPALLGVFFSPLLVFIAIFLCFYKGSLLLDLAAIGILHTALCCAYIQIYPAAQAFSPTLVILLLVGKSMPRGIMREDLEIRLDNDFLLGERLQDLVEARLISANANGLQLTSRGLNLIRFFIIFRSLFGLELGKG